jgi:hypothetical protein
MAADKKLGHIGQQLIAECVCKPLHFVDVFGHTATLSALSE